MAKKSIYWGTFFVIMVYAAVISTLFALEHSKNNQVVAQVDNHEITNAQVMNKIIHDYWDDTLSTMSEDMVIKDEAEKLKITAMPDEIAKEVKTLEDLEHKKIDMNDQAQKDMIVSRVITKKLEQKYVVNEDAIKAFLSEKNGDIGNRSIQIITYETSNHELLDRIAKEAKSNQNIDKSYLKKKFNIKFNEDVLSLNHNPDQLVLDDLLVGNVQHLHSNGKHKIIIVTGIKSIKIDDLNYEQNKARINEVFLNTNYYDLKINLIQYLFDKNHVTVNKI
jgi:hypothetical protein